MKKAKVSRVFNVNAFDVAVVIIVVFLLLCAYIKANEQKISMLFVPYREVDIEMAVTDSYDDFCESLKVGDKVYLKHSGAYFGKVKAIENIYEYEYRKSNNSDILNKIKTDKVIGKKIIVHSKLKKNEDGHFTGSGVFLSPGHKIEVFVNSQENDFAKASVFSISAV